MKTVKNPQATLGRLVEELRSLSAKPIGDHPKNDELAAYNRGGLVGEQMTRVGTHLDSCLDCAASMERLANAAEAWDNPVSETRLAKSLFEKFRIGFSGLRAA